MSKSGQPLDQFTFRDACDRCTNKNKLTFPFKKVSRVQYSSQHFYYKEL